ncbi:hypothetical protein N7G274_001884 [Stereocaulon virgatum]|uniref:Uncharacterized protein n=1 Tax=Stereocaulon virgatum TaxID=373712 RepID=A0ABR4AL07_9LECA
MLQRKCRYSHSWLLFLCALLLQAVPTKGSAFFCSKEIFGVPALADCYRAVDNLPKTDKFLRYFIEEQLATGPPQADWPGWRDLRPTTEQRKSIQVPKFWAFGTCNIALLSFVHGHFHIYVSLASWNAVANAAMATLQLCLHRYGQGGAGTVTSAHGVQTLTVFIWKNGSPFEDTLNDYTSAAFPFGIDPTNPTILKIAKNISDGMNPSHRSSDQSNLTAMATLGRSNSSQGLSNSSAVPLDGS